MSRTTLSVDDADKARFDAFKAEDETVSEAFSRLLDVATDECNSAESGTETDELLARLDEMAETLPTRTADELENRMTRR